MNPLAVAAVKAGLIDKVLLAEFKRWKAPIEIPDDVPDAPKTMEEAAAAIEEVLQSDVFVLTRETDLEIFRQYMTTQKLGSLHVEVPVDPTAPLGLEMTVAELTVTFGVTPMGEYIIPWRSDSIRQEMTNGMTYLIADQVARTRVFFKDLREVYYGDVKAFMVCSPSLIDTEDNVPALAESPNV